MKTEEEIKSEIEYIEEQGLDMSTPQSTYQSFINQGCIRALKWVLEIKQF